MKTRRTPSPAMSELNFLGPVSQGVLAKAGIRDLARLRELGSVAAYLEAKRVDPRVNLNLLWALEGALSGKHWRDVARHDRTSLLLALEAEMDPG